MESSQLAGQAPLKHGRLVASAGIADKVIKPTVQRVLAGVIQPGVLMPTPLRIFLSSPSDVAAERLRAHLIIRKVAREYSRFFDIEPILWEYEPMLATGHFQDWISAPSEADIVVLIIWSRLGTPLPERSRRREYRGIDGRVPVTGTEWEFEDALTSHRLRGAPDLLAYRRSSEPPGATLTDAEKRATQIAQYEAVERFWRRHFEDRGMFLAASARYETLDEFDRRFETDLRNLVERRIKEAAEQGSGAVSVSWFKGSPFRGLEAYDFDDAAIFFGRESDTRVGLARLAETAGHGTAFLLVSGASGSGKSSLVRAGLLPALVAAKAIPEIGLWRRVTMRPGNADPVLALAQALLSGDVSREEGLPELAAPGMTARDLAAHLSASADNPSFPFRKALAEIVSAERARRALLPHEQARLVLVIDQLEELFSAEGSGSDEREAFIRLIGGLARSGVVWVVATIRSDLWHRAAEMKALLELEESGARLELTPPDAAGILEIVRRPAAAAGLAFETDPESGIGLDAVIAEAASAEPGALPLLSVLLDALYRRDVGDNVGAAAATLSFAGYNALGRLDGAIARRAEEVFAAVEASDPDATAAFPQVIRALVTTSAGTGVTARAAPLTAFAPGSPERRLMDKFLAFDARLLVAQNGAEGPEVRVAHEVLLSAWPRAERQVAADRRDIETRARLEGLLRRWTEAAGNERRSALLTGLALHEGSDLVRRWTIPAENPLAVYVAASDKAARSRTRRWIAGSMTVAALFAAVAVIATLNWRNAEAARQLASANEEKAVAERHRAEEANRRNQIAEADRVAGLAQQLEADGRGELATALLLQVAPRYAAERPLTPPVAAGLGRAVRRDRNIVRRDLGNNVIRVAATKDGRTLITSLPTGSIQIWSAPDMVLRHQIDAQHDYPIGLEISPDQTAVLVAGDKVPAVWDLASGRKRFDLAVPDPKKFVKTAIWNPDGALIATGGADNRILLFDGSNGSLVRTVSGPTFEEAQQSALARQNTTSSPVGFGDPIASAVAHATFNLFGAVTDIVFSPDGKTIAASGVADPAAALRLYDVDTGALRATGTGPQVTALSTGMSYGAARLAFDKSGQRIAAIAGENNIQIYDAATGQLLQTLTTSDTEAILITADGLSLISAHRDGSIAMWCAQTGRQVVTLRAHRDTVEGLGFNDDETMFASTATDGTAAIWPVPPPGALCDKDWVQRVRATQPRARLEGHRDIVHRAVFVGHDLIATVSRDTTVRLWRLDERGETTISSTGLPEGDSFLSNEKNRFQLTFSPAGHRLLITDKSLYSDAQFAAWSLDQPRLLALLPGQRLATDLPDRKFALFQTPFESAVFNADGELPQATAGEPKEPDRDKPFSLDFPILPPADLNWAISPDGRRAIGSSRWLTYFKELRHSQNPADADTNEEQEGPFPILFDTATGAKLADLQLDGAMPEQSDSPPRFSHDGKTIVAVLEHAGSGGSGFAMIAAWDAETGNVLGHSDKFKKINRLAISDDGRTVFAWTVAPGAEDTETLALMRLRDGAYAPVRRRFDAGSRPRSIAAHAVSGDGRLVATADADGLVLVWKTEDGSLAGEIAVTDKQIDAMAISRDGRFFAVADIGHALRIVEFESRQVVAAPVFSAPVRTLQFDDNAAHVAALLRGGAIEVVEVAPPLAGLSGDTMAVVDWVRAASLAAVSTAEQRRFQLTAPPALDRPELSALPSAVGGGDERATLLRGAARQALTVKTAKEFATAISAARTAVSGRLSTAVLRLADEAQSVGDASAEARKRILFLYELGLWLAYNVKQEGPEDDAKALSHAAEAIRSLARELRPAELVSLWRAVEAWRPGAPPP